VPRKFATPRRTDTPFQCFKVVICVCHQSRLSLCPANAFISLLPQHHHVSVTHPHRQRNYLKLPEMSSTGTIVTATSPEIPIELTARTAYTSGGEKSNTDAAADIIDASRAHDENVPDGGYGWVIVAACSMICFWFGRYLRV
jgi:hypothetical protein